MTEAELIQEITNLRQVLREKEAKLVAIRREKQVAQKYGLTNEEITRYSRQIFLSELGVNGQLKLKNSSVLVVGAGGLGCPAALYLACAGIGKIGLVDYDDVEINNLHRQLLYSEIDLGKAKVTAAQERLRQLNSNVEVVPYKCQLDSSNALDIIKHYDIVLDATDNVATRYLLNDACVLSGKPLVSGSALRFEGHLTVFNYNGPCYRCVFPTPPAPETVTNCGDGGVLGAAVGTIGILQALETMKILLHMPNVLSGRLLLFDGSETKFRNIRLRTKNPKCAVCSDSPSIVKLIDYEQFCGAKANDKEPNLSLLKLEERISVEEYNTVSKIKEKPHILLDVRTPEEFQICHLKNSINIPLGEIGSNTNIGWLRNKIRQLDDDSNGVPLYVVCRRGNDSQRAVTQLRELLKDDTIEIKDIIGGIHAWSKEIDASFPIY